MASVPENELAKKSPPPATAYDGQPPATGIPVTPPNFGGVDNKPQAPEGDGEWSSNLCDCFDDVPNCCITFWCPCITFGQISEIVDRGSTPCALNGLLYFLIAYLIGCPCLYSCFYRSKMRRQHKLTGSPCNDCLVHFCCESCALCQEYRELKHRGFDVSIGWDENVEKRTRGVTMVPIVQGEMSR